MDIQHLLPWARRSAVVDFKQIEALSRVPLLSLSIGADNDLVRKGDPTSKCFIMMEGLACTSQTLADGRRQTTAMHVPGDIPDLMSLLLDVVDSDIRTLSPCDVIWFDSADLRRIVREDAGIALSFWRRTLVEASVHREWVTNLGRRRADERLAHFFCEMVTRMGTAGKVSKLKCDLPLTHTDLSEIVGLSLVHLNRTLQQLRERQLLRFDGRILEIRDWKRLTTFAGFDDTYLHLKEQGIAEPLIA